MKINSCTGGNQASTSSPCPGSSKKMLMNCPPEVRQMIFKEYFDSTRLTFGYRQINYQFRKVLPTHNALAILSVCRLINQEAGDLWMSRVLLNFEDGKSLLDKLSSLPEATLGAIRHIRTRMINEELQAPDGMREQFVHDLHLLPDLNLNRLQIVSPWGFENLKYFGCPDISRFITTNFPCKELCLITPNSPFHKADTWTPAEVSTAFSAQINSWATGLEEKGDAAPRLTISVIQSTEPNSNRTVNVFNDSARQVLEETVVSTGAMESKIVDPDTSMTGTDEKTVAEISDSEAGSDQDKLRTWLGDVRDEYLLGRENDDLENMTTGDLFPWPHEMRPAYVIIDKYNDVDDIIWPGKNADQFDMEKGQASGLESLFEETLITQHVHVMRKERADDLCSLAVNGYQ
ncbi:hypothetical protein DID88_004131 [Monilinia fructigena]|uniref:F-box domain-containing protein n=1 Tax=Monilinia fructigena TaxID=38457 RepID=A0A395ISK1_9HELO|nr:hypothetical protein DID88_004131 [Monilinia fructigena]